MSTFKRTVFTLTSLALAGVVALATAGVSAAPQNISPAARGKMLLATRACTQCDLGDVDLNGKDLKGVDLTGAKLVGAKFYRADLTNANLSGADLSKANLSFSDLSNANLGSTNLTGANLIGAKGADLSAATTTETTICPSGQAGPCR